MGKLKGLFKDVKTLATNTFRSAENKQAATNTGIGAALTKVQSTTGAITKQIGSLIIPGATAKVAADGKPINQAVAQGTMNLLGGVKSPAPLTTAAVGFSAEWDPQGGIKVEQKQPSTTPPWLWPVVIVVAVVMVLGTLFYFIFGGKKRR